MIEHLRWLNDHLAEIFIVGILTFFFGFITSISVFLITLDRDGLESRKQQMIVEPRWKRGQR